METNNCQKKRHLCKNNGSSLEKRRTSQRRCIEQQRFVETDWQSLHQLWNNRCGSHHGTKHQENSKKIVYNNAATERTCATRHQKKIVFKPHQHGNYIWVFLHFELVFTRFRLVVTVVRSIVRCFPESRCIHSIHALLSPGSNIEYLSCDHPSTNFSPKYTTQV